MTRRALLLASVFALAAACGGGGGGGGSSPVEPTPMPSPTPTPSPGPSIVFTPQGGGSPGISLAAGAASTASTLFLEVRANQVTDLYGVAFDLGYPAGQLQFVRATQGPLLAGGTLQVSSTAAGNLVIGLSNLGPVPGANGSGLLMTLELRATGAGQGVFTFSRNVAANSGGQAINGLSWAAGTVLVTL